MKNYIDINIDLKDRAYKLSVKDNIKELRVSV